MITTPEILETLRRVAMRGRNENTRRLRSAIGSVFRYAVATARADY
ncbi:phage integrase central domain-containing protein [Chelatococcus asaccharovorans]